MENSGKPSRYEGPLLGAARKGRDTALAQEDPNFEELVYIFDNLQHYKDLLLHNGLEEQRRAPAPAPQLHAPQLPARKSIVVPAQRMDVRPAASPPPVPLPEPQKLDKLREQMRVHFETHADQAVKQRMAALQRRAGHEEATRSPAVPSPAAARPHLVVTSPRAQPTPAVPQARTEITPASAAPAASGVTLHPPKEPPPFADPVPLRPLPYTEEDLARRKRQRQMLLAQPPTVLSEREQTLLSQAEKKLEPLREPKPRDKFFRGKKITTLNKLLIQIGDVACARTRDVDETKHTNLPKDFLRLQAAGKTLGMKRVQVEQLWLQHVSAWLSYRYVRKNYLDEDVAYRNACKRREAAAAGATPAS